jgi:hypothetical protein
MKKYLGLDTIHKEKISLLKIKSQQKFISMLRVQLLILAFDNI